MKSFRAMLFRFAPSEGYKMRKSISVVRSCTDLCGHWVYKGHACEASSESTMFDQCQEEDACSYNLAVPRLTNAVKGTLINDLSNTQGAVSNRYLFRQANEDFQ